MLPPCCEDLTVEADIRAHGLVILGGHSCELLVQRALDFFEMHSVIGCLPEQPSGLRCKFRIIDTLDGLDSSLHITAGHARESEDRLAYEAATCELSVRAFDTRTREVFWTTWISVSATAKTGKQLGILDYLNEACAEVAASFASEHYEDGLHTYKGADITAHQRERLRIGVAAK